MIPTGSIPVSLGSPDMLHCILLVLWFSTRTTGYVYQSASEPKPAGQCGVLNGKRICHAGQEAQLYVPRLLSVIGSSEAAGRCFGEAWHKVPLPFLLPWVAQMLSLLDAAQGEALLPPLKVSLYALSDKLSKPLLCLTVLDETVRWSARMAYVAIL